MDAWAVPSPQNNNPPCDPCTRLAAAEVNPIRTHLVSGHGTGENPEASSHTTPGLDTNNSTQRPYTVQNNETLADPLQSVASYSQSTHTSTNNQKQTAVRLKCTLTLVHRSSPHLVPAHFTHTSHSTAHISRGGCSIRSGIKFTDGHCGWVRVTGRFEFIASLLLFN